jgi:hypothetical protein
MQKNKIVIKEVIGTFMMYKRKYMNYIINKKKRLVQKVIN